MLREHLNVFSTLFFAGPRDEFDPLKIGLKLDACPVRLKLRNYFQRQREFSSEFVAQLVHNGLAYSNPTSI